MTTRIFLTVAACLALALPGLAQKEDDPFQPDKETMIRVQVEWIETSLEQLTALMAEPRTTCDDTDLRKKASALIAEGKAVVRETMLCTVQSGLPAQTESVQEMIYPTEYDAAQIPSKNNPPNAEAVGPNPTAFATRNVGSTLQLEATLDSGGKRINLTLNPEIICHTGNRVWSEWKDLHGETNVQMPGFYTLRFKNQAKLLPGKPLLAAALSPQNDAGFPDYNRKLMVFLRADVLQPGQAPPSP